MNAKKFFIATDERTGCTEFTCAFSVCGLSYIDDPQTVLAIGNHPLHAKVVQIAGTNNNNNLDQWVPRVLNAYDVVKVCFISYTIQQYLNILMHALGSGYSIIVVHRDPFKRAVSLEVAKELTRQTIELKKDGIISQDVYVNGYSNGLLEEWVPFSIDPKFLEADIVRYSNFMNQVLEWLDKQELSYFYLNIDNLHSKMSIPTYKELFSKLGLQVTDQSKLSEFVNYRPASKNKFVKNLDQLRSASLLVPEPVSVNSIKLID